MSLLFGGCGGAEERGGSEVACPAPAIEGCVPDGSTGDLGCTLEHDGVVRSYRVVVPDAATCSDGSPLVFDLHGLTSNPVQEEWISGLGARGREDGFVVVQPAGIGEVPSWNAGTCCGTSARDGVDDVGFLDAVRARVGAALAIDARRVYATGLSNGGYLSHRLACERADVYAAIAPVAGVLGVPRCDSTRPVPVLQFHGTDDQLVPYHGGGMGGGLSAPGTMAFWAARNGCEPTPVVTLESGDVTCARWQGCARGADVELCTVAGGGHTWPGGPDLILPALGRTTDDVDATAALWEFFTAHPLPAATSGDDWTPGIGPEVPEEAPSGEGCDVGGLGPPAARHAARLVMPGAEGPEAVTGGDAAGDWTISSASLYLPPIAASQVLADQSEVLVAGRAALGEDGRFALLLDVTGEIATASYGTLHLVRHVRATGTWQTDGGALQLTADCGALEVPVHTELSRIDDAHARLGWLLSSGLIGDVRLVVTLERS